MKTVHQKCLEMLALLGDANDRYEIDKFVVESGCGLATGKDGAHVVFRTVEGVPMALTITPSMIERWRFQWNLSEIDVREIARDSLPMESHHTIDDAARLLWMMNRGTRTPVDKTSSD